MRRPNPALVLGVLVVAGLALRLPLLGSSLWGDELGTHFVVTDHDLRRTLELVASEQEVTPPFFFVLAWLTAKLGDPTVTVRLAPLVAGVATIPLTYLLGVRTVGRGAGLVGAALVSFSPMLVFFSTEGRAYAVVVLLALLSTLALLEAVRTGTWWWWVAYGVCSLVAVYTHYTVVFLLAVQLAWMLWAHPRARRPALAVNAVAALCFLPWLSEFREDGLSPCSKVIAAGHPFGFETFYVDLGHLVVGHPYFGLDGAPGHPILVAFLVGLVLTLAGGALRLRRPSREAVLIAALAAVPLLVALYSAVSDNSIYAPRNLLTAIPALAVGAGALLARTPVRPLRIAAGVLLVGATAAAGARMLAEENRRPDHEGVAAFIVQESEPGDPVVDADVPLTPGPFQATTVALLEDGRHWTVQPTVNLSLPVLEQLVAARDAGSADPCTSQYAPLEDPAAAARRTATLARGGRIFLVTEGHLAPAQLRADDPRIERFVGALPDYDFAEVRRFRGVEDAGLSVYVLRRR